MRRIMVLTTVLASLALLSCQDDAPPKPGLTLGQVVDLIALGYSDAEIQDVVSKAGPPPSVDGAAEERLRAAGATDALVAFLKGGASKASPPPTPSSPPGRVAVALAALEAREPIEKVLDRIAGAAPEAPTELERTQVAAAPLPVRLALLGQPISVAHLEELARDRTSERVFLQVLALVGTTGEPISASRALALRGAGVPSAALRAFTRGGPSALTAADRTSAAGYAHVGRRFLMQTPDDWVLLRDIHEGSLRYVFTPEKHKRVVDEVDVALVLSLGAPQEGSVWSHQSPQALLERMLPWVRILEPEMSPVGTPEAAKLGSLDAASQSFEGTPRGRSGRYRSRLVVAEADGLVYNAAAVAPESSFETWDPVFRHILATSTFGRLGHPGRAGERDAAAFAEACKPSVVIVKVRDGSSIAQGTGFIISKTGYALTNWHVVWNSDTGRPYDRISVAWDDSLARPEVKATVLGAHHKLSAESQAGGMLGGTDVALLRLDPGDYVPVKLSPTSTVKLGDPVVNLGFPQSFSVAGLSLFVTRGVVVRFNRDVMGRTVGIAVDAKHAPGSSGGPCFNLRTGGVMGLTTWSYKIGGETEAGQSSNDMVGYYFLCPTDDALAHFPVVADLGYEHDHEFDFLSSYELAGQFLALSSSEAALAMADRAVEMDPQSVDALIQQALCLQALAYEALSSDETAGVHRYARRAEASLERAAIVEPERPEPRILLASLCLQLHRLEDAQKHATKAVESYPDRWDAHMVAARVSAARQQVEEAVAHLKEAKRASRDMVPDPYLFAGDFAYARGWLEAGKQEFDRAAALHPGSHDAQVGVADFLVHKRRWNEAIEAFRALRGQFPRSPLPLHRIAFCFKGQKRHDEALSYYLEAEEAFRKAGIVPPEGFFIEQADIYAAQESSNEVQCLAKHLLYRGAGPQSIPIHLRLARFFRDKDVHGLSTMHIRRAVLWAQLDGKELKPEGFKTVDPDIQHIAWMVKDDRYPVSVAVDLIENGRLSYRFPTEDEARQEEYEKLRRNGVPHEVILAIIESNKRYPRTESKPEPVPTKGSGSKPTSPATGKPPQNTQPPPTPPPPTPPPPEPEDNSQALRALLGSWRFRTIDPLLGEVDLTMTFNAAGQWASQGVMGGFRVDDGGTFAVEGSTISCIVRRSTNPVIRPGTPMTLSFQATATTLRLYDQSSRQWTTFQRVR